MEKTSFDGTEPLSPEALNQQLRTLGERLRSRRQAMGWTRRVMAEKTGVKENTIETVEQGRTRPSSEQVLACCRYLNVSPNWLLTGSDQWMGEDEGQPETVGSVIKIIIAMNLLPPVKRKLMREVLYDLARVNVPALELQNFERLLSMDFEQLDGIADVVSLGAAEGPLKAALEQAFEGGK